MWCIFMCVQTFSYEGAHMCVQMNVHICTRVWRPKAVVAFLNYALSYILRLGLSLDLELV